MLVDSKKLSLGVIALGGVAVFVVLVLVLVSSQMPEQVPSAQPQEQEQEEPSEAPQARVFGISGIVRQVDEASSSFAMETPALPYEGFRPQKGEVWIWQVDIQEDTELVLFAAEEHEENFHEEPGARQDIVVGSVVTVMSKGNMAEQFAVPEKRMQAERIEINNFIAAP